MKANGNTAWSLGRSAERRAERLLRRAGLRCLARNWRCRGGELDLVMADGDTVVFVEVRRRSGSSHGNAAASVGPRKQRRIVHAALYYLQTLEATPECRFDLVTLDGAPGAEVIRWIPAAFDASGMV